MSQQKLFYFNYFHHSWLSLTGQFSINYDRLHQVLYESLCRLLQQDFYTLEVKPTTSNHEY